MTNTNVSNNNVKINFWYERDEYGYYLNARIDTPRGVRTMYDTTTEEAIVEAIKDVDINLETDYDCIEDEKVEEKH